MKILFLDIDGVLNNVLDQTRNEDELITENWLCINKANLANVLALIEKFDLKVVISSDWRRNERSLSFIRSVLAKHGIPIFGNTKITNQSRSEEIREWVLENSPKSAIILDDLPASEVHPEMENILFHQTDYRFGFTEEDLYKLFSKLVEQSEMRLGPCKKKINNEIVECIYLYLDSHYTYKWAKINFPIVCIFPERGKPFWAHADKFYRKFISSSLSDIHHSIFESLMDFTEKEQFFSGNFYYSGQSYGYKFILS